jgi:hypothetical protein
LGGLDCPHAVFRQPDLAMLDLGLHRTFEPKTSHGQELEAETIAQLVAAALARLYGRPADGFSWTYIASQAQSGSPQKVGRICIRVLKRVKKVLELIYSVPDQPSPI